MSIDWWTVGLQAVNFLILVAVLHRFLYRPVKRAIAERSAEIEEQVIGAEAAREQAEALVGQREAELAAIAEQQASVRRATHERVETERAEILDEARREAGEIAESVRRDLDHERAEILDELRAEITEMATDLARRLLEEARFGHASEPFLERLVEQLRSMSAHKREALVRDVSEARPIAVICAPPLPEERWAIWCDRLEDLLGRHPIELAADEAMIAGAEIRFPHTNLVLSWRDALESARLKVHASAGAA
jgi:F-type H+-transporting ATPase subunit b